MRQHRGSAERTLADYRPLAAAFIESRRGHRWDRLDAKTVRSYVIEECKKLTQARRLVFVRALRMFMRFLVSTGRCRSHLDRSVPSMPHWRLATLPRYVDEDVIERLIASRSTKTVPGIRDRAVLLLLARLALRAGDVRGLCLSDIDWARGQLRVVGKLRRPTWLPIPQDVGDSILAYLRVRPRCRHDQVFLCIKLRTGPSVQRALAASASVRSTSLVWRLRARARTSSGTQWLPRLSATALPSTMSAVCFVTPHASRPRSTRRSRSAR